MLVLEILGAAAAVITIFSAGFAAGKFFAKKNDRHQFSEDFGDHFD